MARTFVQYGPTGGIKVLQVRNSPPRGAEWVELTGHPEERNITLAQDKFFCAEPTGQQVQKKHELNIQAVKTTALADDSDTVEIVLNFPEHKEHRVLVNGEETILPPGDNTLELTSAIAGVVTIQVNEPGIYHPVPIVVAFKDQIEEAPAVVSPPPVKFKPSMSSKSREV